MNAGQYEGLMAALGEIRDRLPVLGPPAPGADLERETMLTRLAEWEAIVGLTLPEATRAAHARHRTGKPYDLTTALGRALKVDKGGQLGSAGRGGAHRALKTMLGVLDGWIQGQQENHQGMGHRHENRGDECWRTFAPSDIRRMVNDAAREVGLDTEFAEPEMAQEDRPL